MRFFQNLFLPFIIAIISFTAACHAETPQNNPRPTERPSRLDAIPENAEKVSPNEDWFPPIIADGWSQPQPVGAPINTAGGEDSPFITMDGNDLYFFFTPDVNIPAEKQLLDKVTGIWVAHHTSEGWNTPRRIVLGDNSELHLDGCPFVLDDLLIFCTIRESTEGKLRLFSAHRENDTWTNWKDWQTDNHLPDNVGEMHLTPDKRLLCYGASGEGSLGMTDLWCVSRMDNGWSNPYNLGEPVNSPQDENRPYLSPDGKTIWFDGTSRAGYPGPAIFRSQQLEDGTWSAPQEIVSQFSAEPTLTADGQTLYFVHFYFTKDLNHMIEGDIYVSHKTSP